ncbi:hypothetical protein [Cytophaga aurantiaca]|uniref:hypothetical protein n=1 Tax=Cytophaga aurantiaca TaxID=29530 RepID=UPI00037A655B|nr:hypothetical protein [Cytophaga aurantiaca]
MGKRLTRISGPQIRLSLPQLAGLEAAIVLLNGSTFYGIIGQLKNNTCLFKDFRNYEHVVALDQIAEIITDNVSSY